MNKIKELIKSEGIGCLLKRIFYSIQRKIYNRYCFYSEVKWNNRILGLQKKASFDKRIKFSIIVPVYNTPENYLRDMLESCVMQTYPEWELCIADASDEDHAYIGHVIMEKKDYAVRYIKLDCNRGISGNTNEALALASGDYFVLLDHDDMLHPCALYECMAALNEQYADMIYTDELVFSNNIRNIKSIHSKPDFSPDTLRGNNYICHMAAFSRGLLQKAGFFRKEYDGSQDHDMILRLTEQARNIIHIPKVLYFWRSHNESVAGGISAKSYAADAGRHAVMDHLKRIGRSGKVESNPEFPTVYNIRYDVPEGVRISVLIWGTLKNRVSYEDICRLEKNTGYGLYDISVGGSVLPDDVALLKQKCTVYDNKININEFFKTAAGKSEGSYIVCMYGMSDVVSKDWLEQLLMLAQWEETGAVGPRTVDEKDIVLDCGAYFKDNGSMKLMYCDRGTHRRNCGYMMRSLYAHNIDIPSATCIMAAKDKLLGHAMADSLLPYEYCIAFMCMRLAEKGYKNVSNPLAEIRKRPY